MVRGTRKVGLFEQMGYGRKRKALPTPPTPEQQAAIRALTETHLRKMAIEGGVPAEEIDAWVAEKAA